MIFKRVKSNFSIILFIALPVVNMGNEASKVQANQNQTQIQTASQKKKKKNPLPQPNINNVLDSLKVPNSSFISITKSDIFMMESVENIRLQAHFNDFVYEWIDKRVYNDENSNIMHAFNIEFTYFEEFDDPEVYIDHLKRYLGNRPIRVIASTALDDKVFDQMNKSRYVEKIVLFSQNTTRSDELMRRYPKILHHARTSLEVVEMARQNLIYITNNHGQRQRVFYQYKINMLFMFPDEIQVINKYWINYQCLRLYQDRQFALNHFLELARKIYPGQQNLIDEFERSNAVTDNVDMLTKDWMFRDSFYWNLVENIPKVTNDPKKLAYLRLAFKDMYQTIKNYYQNIKQTVINQLRSIYIVVHLTDSEKRSLASNVENYLIFSSFVRGYTNLAAANNYIRSFPQQARSNVFLFETTVLHKSSFTADLDHGYIILNEKRINDRKSTRPDVIFNIFNYFKLRSINLASSAGELLYGGLAEAYEKRRLKECRKQLKEKDKYLLSEYDKTSTVLKSVRNQGSAFLISGSASDSLAYVDSEIVQAKQSQDSTLNSQGVDTLLLEKGSALEIDKQYDNAIIVYHQIEEERKRLVAMSRIVSVYLDRGDETNARQYFLDHLNGNIERFWEWEIYSEYFRAKHNEYRLLMLARNYRLAHAGYKELKERVLEHFDYKSVTLPFWEKIIENYNECSNKMVNAPIV